MASDDSLRPIQIIIDEMKNEDVQLRLNSVRRLSTIATALKEERTRTELIPFLLDCLDDEDEVLLVIAEELGNFVQFVGADQAHCLLEPLELLAAGEDTKVRNKSTAAINKIAASFSESQNKEHFLPLLKRLCGGDWFTSRSSASALFAHIYPKIDDAGQKELRELYEKLASDSFPVVRRNAGEHFAGFIGVVDKKDVTDVLPILKQLAKDEQDSVRFQVVSACIAFAEKLDSSEVKENILPIASATCVDKAWRVRYMAADKINELIASLGDTISKGETVKLFCGLMKDPEAEVRTAAASKVTSVCKIINDPDLIITDVLSKASELANDSSQHVRASLASVVMGLAPLLGKDKTINNLLDLFLRLLKDESPDVRLNIISKLDAVNEVIGIDLLSQSLLPAIVELAEDRQWRVRLAIIEYIPLLATQLGVKFFDEKLSDLCMSWLGDSVYSVREAATCNFKKLMEIFGFEWAQQNVIPKVLEYHSHPKYLYRMTMVFAVKSLAKSVPKEVLTDTMLPLVLKLADDNVPNIRFNVAIALGEVIPLVDASVAVEKIKPVLETLSKDGDNDVRYFSSQALLQIP